MEVAEPGERVHYRELDRRLRANGYMAAGLDPANTLLTALGRSPYISGAGHRSGIFWRNEPQEDGRATSDEVDWAAPYYAPEDEV